MRLPRSFVFRTEAPIMEDESPNFEAQPKVPTEAPTKKEVGKSLLEKGWLAPRGEQRAQKAAPAQEVIPRVIKDESIELYIDDYNSKKQLKQRAEKDHKRSI